MVLYEFEGKQPRIAETAFIFPTAVIIGDVKIGENCFIGPNAVLRGDWGYIEVGNGSNIQDNCVIHSVPDQETVLDENCHIGHGAVVHQSKLGKHVLIGMNAVVLNWVEIGDECIIGGGCVVPQRMIVEPYSIVLGVPGKVFGRISENQEEYSWWATKMYQTLPKRYHETLKQI
ncbi:MAG: gamma carbonic anhydrase family protein [Candidatus Odinarchaeota archaeon]